MEESWPVGLTLPKWSPLYEPQIDIGADGALSIPTCIGSVFIFLQSPSAENDQVVVTRFCDQDP